MKIYENGPAMSLEEAISCISGLALRGGPHRHEYELFWQACSSFASARVGGHVSEAEHQEFMASLGPAGTPESLMGHIFHKPYGYAGDFQIIDKLYTNYLSPHPMVTRWDEFVQAVPSSNSVRNRGPYLLNVVKAMAESRADDHPMHVVSLGSGPGRDIEHALDGVICLGKKVRVTCVDMDERALAHSERVLAPHAGIVRHVKSDVLRLNLDEPADLIWSSGLFDYFSDRAFAAVLQRVKKSVSPGGRIVVGNFSERCSGHGPMAFVNWHLVLRSAHDLRTMAARAGASGIAVDSEPVGLNLFLHVECGA